MKPSPSSSSSSSISGEEEDDDGGSSRRKPAKTSGESDERCDRLSHSRKRPRSPSLEETNDQTKEKEDEMDTDLPPRASKRHRH